MNIVTKTDDGRFVVSCRGTIIAGPFNTNAEAWRAMDRMEGEPISRSEKTADWLHEQGVGL